MSTQGTGRTRIGRKTHSLPTSITGTQPAFFTPPDASFVGDSQLGSPSSDAHISSPGSSTLSRTVPEQQIERDLEGRILVSISTDQ